MKQWTEGTKGQRNQGIEAAKSGISGGKEVSPECGEAVHSLWEGGPPCCLKCSFQLSVFRC